MTEPSHRILVRRCIQEARLKERLSTYSYIGSHYNLDDLKKCERNGPYYCHYLAWRLGAWEDEDWFALFDGLLANASSLNGWNNGKNKKSLMKDCSFDKFWQLLWELQVAKFFSGLPGVEVEWLDSGPDLKITIGQDHFYVECYTYTKSFGIMTFIEELCHKVDPRIKVKHGFFNTLSLPQNAQTDDFLDQVFRPILELPSLDHAATIRESRVLFTDPNIENFIVYLEGSDLQHLPSGLLVMQMRTGDPEEYLRVAVSEALRSKIKDGRLKNQLEQHRPNLLAVNFLLSADYQVASYIQNYLNRDMPLPEIWQRYDGILLTTCGINELPSASKFYVRCTAQNHPIWTVDEIKPDIQTQQNTSP
jgi:hypothetical protein